MKANRAIAVLLSCLVTQACVTQMDVGPQPASNEEQARANLALGVGYLRQGDAESAVRPLERAVETQPRLADAHGALAFAYDQLGRIDEAERHYRRAANIGNGDGSAQNSYAVFLCRQGDFERAEPLFLRAVENPRYPTPVAALDNAANCAYEAGFIDKAERYFRAALDIESGDAAALSGMLEISFHMQNYLQARAFLQRSFASQARSARMLWLCYHIEIELDSESAANACLSQLQREFPYSPELDQIVSAVPNAN